jgi:hypothetical protein
MEPDAQSLVDLASTDIVSVPGTASVGDARAAAGGAEWAVITDAASRPVQVLHTSELDAVQDDRVVASLDGAPVFVLPSRLPLDLVGRTSQAARIGARLLQVRAIVVYDQDPTRPVGVWGGSDFGTFLSQLSPSRSYDSSLPGNINLPPIRRPCSFFEAAVVCEWILECKELPDDMPECENPKQLTAHAFSW